MTNRSRIWPWWMYAATGYLLVWVVIAFFAPWVSVDKTYLANNQVVELARRPPGTRAWLLEVPLAGQATVRSHAFWLGKTPSSRPIPLRNDSVAVKGEYLTYKTLAGVESRIALDRLSPEKKAPGQEWEPPVQSVFFPLGTDTYGRDLWSRLAHGSRISLGVGLAAMVLSISLGVFAGALAGFFGGWTDRIVMWFVSVVWSIPTLLLALALSFVLGKGLGQLMLAIGLSIWIDTARLVRGQLMGLREQTFAEAARSLGIRRIRILWRHLLPNVWAPILVMSVSNFGSAILIESGLSFLGLGVEAPVPSWGSMIYEGYTQIMFESGVWLAFIPGLCLILLVVSVNLVGIGLRDQLDIRPT